MAAMGRRSQTSTPGPSHVFACVGGFSRGGGSPRLWTIAAGLLLVLLSGCTSWREYVQNGFKVGPNYCKPGAEVAKQWIDAGNPDVSSGPAHDAAWWKNLHDPILDTLVFTAYRQNLTLRAAAMRILQARGAVRHCRRQSVPANAAGYRRVYP